MPRPVPRNGGPREGALGQRRNAFGAHIRRRRLRSVGAWSDRLRWLPPPPWTSASPTTSRRWAKPMRQPSACFPLPWHRSARTCHNDKFQQWGNSVHAGFLVRDGNAGAQPICTGLPFAAHHAMKGGAGSVRWQRCPAKPVTVVIFDIAYTASVHGVIRGARHARGTALLRLSRRARRGGCLCRRGTARRLSWLSHRGDWRRTASWPPNVTILHFGVVSCPVWGIRRGRSGWSISISSIISATLERDLADRQGHPGIQRI